VTSTQHRVALVTGAARGIGAATVRRLVADGLSVVALDSCQGDDRLRGPGYPLASRSELSALASELGERVVPAVADVRDRASVKSAVAAAVERWGRLDIAVAAAAVIAGGQPLWKTTDAQFDLLWDVDVKGVWNTAAVTVPAMLRGPDPSGCRFLAVASAAGSHGLYWLSAYTAAKHAVVGIVRGLAADLVGTGVTAAAVSPGSTDTPMLAATAGIYGLSSVSELAKHQLLRRVITPAEIAETIAYCCSPAGAVVNGTVVHADGGFPG
jgi:SDR family mycofactocin-dependent oxidoreductase